MVGFYVDTKGYMANFQLYCLKKTTFIIADTNGIEKKNDNTPNDVIFGVIKPNDAEKLYAEYSSTLLIIGFVIDLLRKYRGSVKFMVWRGDSMLEWK